MKHKQNDQYFTQFQIEVIHVAFLELDYRHGFVNLPMSRIKAFKCQDNSTNII